MSRFGKLFLWSYTLRVYIYPYIDEIRRNMASITLEGHTKDMTDIRRKIAQRIRACRTAAGWTVEDTATRLSRISSETISPSRYGNWEQQIRTPKIEQFVELAALFKSNAAYLAGLTDNDGTAPEAGLYCVPKPTGIATTTGVLDIGDDSLAYRLTFLEGLKLDRSQLLPVAVPDSSMRGILEESDLVLIDRSVTTVTRDDLFALMVNGRLWLRWIRQGIDGTYSIQAEDRDNYPDQVMDADKLSTLHIIGRVKITTHIR